MIEQKLEAYEQNGCFKKLFYGECDSQNCSYSHDAAVLRLAYQNYADLLKQSKYKPSVNLSHIYEDLSGLLMHLAP